MKPLLLLLSITFFSCKSTKVLTVRPEYTQEWIRTHPIPLNVSDTNRYYANQFKSVIHLKN